MIRRFNPQLLREPKHWGRRDRQVLLVTIFVIALWMGMLYLSQFQEAPTSSVLRYGATLPVATAAYFYGLGAGMVVALFFSSAFWAQAYATFLSTGFTFISAEMVAATFLLFVIAYVVADLAGSIQSHNALAIAVRDREALLSRASNLNRVTEFILRQARQAYGADESYIILSNPLNGMWEITGSDMKKTLQDPVDEDQETLAFWLIEHGGPLYLQDLDADDSMIAPNQPNREQLHSLLSRPLKHSDGSQLGILVIIKREGENFSHSDLQVLDDLILPGQKALEQAGMYARTDYALEQRITQLAAIQRTTREINSTFDMRRIVDLTLHCAIEITVAEAGTIILDTEDLIQLIRERGEQADGDRSVYANLEQVLREGKTPVLSPDEIYLPPFFPKSQSQLLAVIQRRSQTMGAIVVESPKLQAFDETSGWALSLLADHVATALENSRLFSEIQKEKQQIGLIIDSIADGLITTDWEGNVISLNPAGEEMTGWKLSDLGGRPLIDVFHMLEEKHMPDDQKSLVRALKDIPPHTTEKLLLKQRLGSKLIVSLSAAPVWGEDDRPVGLVILFRDVTKSDELDRLQQELIAAISHEMRTPLTKISTISESMLMQLQGRLNRKQVEHLEVMVAESQRLAKFFDRVLNVHHLESAEFDFEMRPLPLAFVLQDVIDHWTTAEPGHEFVLKQPVPPLWANADESGLFLILNNLVDNAVKYSPPGTRIELSLRETPEGQALIGVRDSGKGIAPEYQTRIFERFYRVDGGDAQTVYGHGLGLYITRLMVGAMGGRIWVESELSQGSLFAFTLSLVKPNLGIAEEEPIETQNPGD